MQLWNRTPLFHSRLHFRYVFYAQAQNYRPTKEHNSSHFTIQKLKIKWITFVQWSKQMPVRDVNENYSRSLAIREWPTLHKEVTVKAIKSATLSFTESWTANTTGKCSGHAFYKPELFTLSSATTAQVCYERPVEVEYFCCFHIML